MLKFTLIINGDSSKYLASSKYFKYCVKINVNELLDQDCHSISKTLKIQTDVKSTKLTNIIWSISYDSMSEVPQKIGIVQQKIA